MPEIAAYILRTKCPCRRSTTVRRVDPRELEAAYFPDVFLEDAWRDAERGHVCMFCNCPCCDRDPVRVEYAKKDEDEKAST